MLRIYPTTFSPAWRPSLFFALFLLAFSSPLAAQTPVFLDPAPPNETVDCFSDVPTGRPLRAAVTTPRGPDTINVNPVDNLSNPNAPCIGGTVTRTWRVSDGNGVATQTQVITFGAPDLLDGPSINVSLLPVANDTVDCRSVNRAGDPESYARWLGDRRLAVAAAARPGCAPISSIEDDAPTSLRGYDCNDRLEVLFTVTDLCGETAMVAFSYFTVDTVGPTITGVVNDTIFLDCAAVPPIPPNVALTDCDTLPRLMFSEMSNRQFDNTCREYEYEITRTYLATDACGNMTTATTVLAFRDGTPPDFTRPQNLNISCTDDPFDLNFTGRPTALSDNCAALEDLDITFTDEIISGVLCGNSFNVRRTWRVTDPCGNSRIRVQDIRVRDEGLPTFTPPAQNLTTDCGNFQNLSSSDAPRNLLDDCDETVNLSFTDNVTPGSCPGNFTVVRTWRIFDDCDNDRFFIQNITVIDTTGPVFTVEPTDLVTTCNTGSGETSQEQRFNLWLADLAGARFTDACTPSADLRVSVVETGTNNFPLFPDINCAEADGTVRRLSVDIIVTDQCNNSTTATVLYRQIDELPINLFNCPPSVIVGTDEGTCTADVSFVPPTVEDQCANGLPFELRLRDTVVITSNATNQAELGSVPVNAFFFNLPINRQLPVNASTNGVYTITLENIDAEGDDEFFFIYGEDGTLLGTTAQGTVQCETVVTIDTLPAALFNRYASDGVITLRLEPNIPAGRPGTFAINNLCDGGSRARIDLRQPAFRLTAITYEMDIDGAGFVVVSPLDSVLRGLSLGLHQITYRVTDCGGNSDECRFTVTVEDQEAPEVTCPADIEVVLAPDSCQTRLTLPLPVEVTDNCDPYTLSFEEGPGDPRLPFFFDPNLNSYQAGELTVVLRNAPAVLVDSVDIDVRFRGRFDNPRAILDVVLPGGAILGSTASSMATCTSEGLLRLKLSAADFAAGRSADGNFTLHLRPRPVTVPPGVAGEGLIPCAVDAVEEDGDNDGISRASVLVTYRAFYPAFATTGATQTPLTATSPANPQPVVVFNQGITAFTYRVTDAGGNIAECTFNVTVRDETPPIAVCQATTVFVDPSGVAPITLAPEVIGGESTDNCGIASMALDPNIFTCEQYGEAVPLTLVVTDASGNETSCTTMASIAPLGPEPTATTSLCGGDTLRLFANPPTVASPGQTIYTFRWFDPAGNLLSTQENPVIPGVNQNNGGAYRVEIRGITGCVAEGVVNVAIGAIPVAPVVVAPARVCTDDDAALRSVSVYPGSVRYEWFRGEPGAGVLLGESTAASFSAPFASGASSGTFYAIVYVNGCASPPSNVVTVGTTTRPAANAVETAVTACEFGEARFVADPVPNVEYQWTGPNAFLATGQELVLTDLDLAQSGTYYLRTVRSEGCFSLPDSVVLTVLPADAPTTLSATANVCPSDTLVLRASDASGVAYLFAGPAGQLLETTGAELRIAPVTPALAGEWTVRIRRDQCFSAPSLPVNVRLGTSPQARASIIPDPVCAGNDLILQGASNIAGSSYRWTGPNGFVANQIAPLLTEVTDAVNGNYVLTVTSPSGCFARDTVEVNVLEGIVVDSIVVSSGRCLNGGETVSLSANITPALPAGGSYFYQWTGPEGTSTAEVFEIPNVSLASNGVYTLTVSNAAGCVAERFSMTVNFDFAPAAPVRPFTPSGATSICAGDDLVLQTNDFGAGTTYLWQLGDGTNIPTTGNSLLLREVEADLSGAFTVRVIRNGCTSLPSEGRNITVTPFPAITVQADDPACEGQEINFQATDLAGATYSWRGPNNFSSSLPNPTIARADAAVHAGRYSVVATINGCSSDTMFVEVSVLPTPGAPVAQPISPVCLSDPDAVLELRVNPNTATPGATYQWFIQNGQVAVGAPTESLVFPVQDFGLFAGGGLFDFSVRASLAGCSSPLSSPVLVRLDAAGDEVADAGRDTVVCAGLYLLEAGPIGSGSGRWTLVQGTGDISIVNPGSLTTAVRGLTEFGGPYRFAWTLSNGSCVNFASDTVTISVTDGEEAIAGDNILACLREDLRLNASPVMFNGSGGRWSQALAQEILGVVIAEPTNPNTRITGLRADNVYSFTWTVTSNCGVKADNVLVNVSDPNPFAGEDVFACTAGRTATLGATPTTLGSTGRWFALDDGATIANPGNATTEVANLRTGENRFVWEADAGFCGDSSRDTVSVFYSDPPRPRDDALETEFQTAITFDPTLNDANPEGSIISFPTLPAEGGTLTDNGDGTFTYDVPVNFVGEIALDYVVSSENCATASATVFILVGKDVPCNAPNIFTPNNDGMNDRFVVPCLLDRTEFPQSQVTIYNQWGDEVYRSGIPYENDWDGTYQGSDLPVGTYFFIIDFGGARERESGDVRIER
ncbi:gliding motility-associated C-terminal domain-containing protein [Neolewinella lacunae]|uniref:Gliding motility-associated C-terminal domain-containing protein n=1 Tax=Neolewinella lacunae TaxID=1517758 RepID=A0A923PI37_9BACT|nr:gliding motility-associated C-terminal domain-containing protein [Neolewinella lacunae]MBC6993704.1 gliding motility-associated C-terminal domain-containing protein [Neolewinella lacunae]MDN3636124.1 gliding motility-associated C-terminal domain-containing protein [Neolewinella lacunae]